MVAYFPYLYHSNANRLPKRSTLGCKAACSFGVVVENYEILPALEQKKLFPSQVQLVATDASASRLNGLPYPFASIDICSSLAATASSLSSDAIPGFSIALVLLLQTPTICNNEQVRTPSFSI